MVTYNTLEITDKWLFLLLCVGYLLTRLFQPVIRASFDLVIHLLYTAHMVIQHYIWEIIDKFPEVTKNFSCSTQLSMKF